MRWTRTSQLLLATALLGAGCGNLADDTTTAVSSALGDRLPGLQGSTSLLTEASTAFNNFEDINDGLGPIFNAQACGQCHSNGAIGGAGEQIERRFGRFDNGVFNPLANEGGSLRQLFTVGQFTALNNTSCNVPLEHEPADATVHNVGRLTTPTFGLGLVDAMPDSFFDGLVAAEPAAVRGTVNRGQIVLPNPGDPAQSIGTTRVTRFGWKAGVPTLTQFSADAYVNEMGISTQHCSKGTSVNNFAVESAPNGVPVSANCDDRAPRQTGTNPGGLTATQWAQVDDAVGSCAGGRSEVQDDVFLFAVFMTGLAPGPRDLSDAISVNAGQPIFSQIGCNGCHVTTTFRTPASPAAVSIDAAGSESVRVPGNFAFNPFSDFAVHDMGTLGDRIGNAGDSIARTQQMRTAPLWGIRFRNHLLHDGRCGDIPCAVRAHDGQAAAARNAFNALSSANQHNVVQFVRSL
ncbi:MAG TPA: di-heme oxidoredictase family protein [Polyangia bacterium]|nr:di-heme oxidoredictase family protein [Polyangia bacterium]